MSPRRIFVLIFLINFCPNLSLSKNKNFRWTTKTVGELSCDGMSEFFDQDVHDDSMGVNSEHKKMYIVLTSASNIQRLSRIYTGKTMRSVNELKKACPHIVFKSSYGRKYCAFGKESNFDGNSSSTSPIRIKHNGPIFYYRAKVVFIWSDARRYTLHLVCIKNSLHYVLTSMKPSVDKRTKKIVMRKISQIGFDPNNAVVIPHGKCPRAKE